MDRPSLPAKLIMAAAILGGVSFLAANRFALSDTTMIVWKGSGVALLAVYAATRAKTLDGWLLTAVMALGATGDVLLETHGLITGAVAFLAGHLVAIALYLRNRRPALQRSQLLLAILIIPATVVIAYLLPADRAGAPGIALYSTGLAAMAATAWISRFPRMSVGLGALMFVASDLFIFARTGPLAGLAWVSPAVWALYFAGQLRICLGVARTLAQENT
ncbi:lysoplasmalogenase family protein [Phenylobacterium sp.]|uniref:lysoplasmalogenase family protein n=1 Tax=Phenylobacterium sp. TaxID=1871053 RepID=UPI002719D31F|nr:lysoplasmalogenase family protein [Phenylobacterium sp.]MDO8801451.1 lysoplasmalogenase family protein [Phenylobacterium sp.]